MAVPTSYKKPRKLNVVSLLLVLAALALLYAGVQFGPPHYRKWKAKGVLAETANMVYPKRFHAGGEWLDQITANAVNRLRDEIGIEDKGLSVRIHRDRANITVDADYKERISHPVVGKVTELHFRPFVQLPIQRP